MCNRTSTLSFTECKTKSNLISITPPSKWTLALYCYQCAPSLIETASSNEKGNRAAKCNYYPAVHINGYFLGCNASLVLHLIWGVILKNTYGTRMEMSWHHFILCLWKLWHRAILCPLTNVSSHLLSFELYWNLTCRPVCMLKCFHLFYMITGLHAWSQKLY